MRCYVVNDIREEGMEALEKLLADKGYSAGLEKLYWIPVPKEYLTPIQLEPASCGPHVMALETSFDSVSMELLVRARNNLRCDCIGYADAETIISMIGVLHSLLDEAKIEH